MMIIICCDNDDANTRNESTPVVPLLHTFGRRCLAVLAREDTARDKTHQNGCVYTLVALV